MTDEFETPDGYRILHVEDLAPQIAAIADLRKRLGGAPEAWTAAEISDGNMNAVYRLTGPSGSLIVKQALPYIRVIGEGWPFPVSRIHFEAAAMARQAELAPAHVPALLHRDDGLGLLVMEDLRGHAVVRQALVAGTHFPRLAAHMGEFLARTLFFTSDFHLATPQTSAIEAAFSGNAHLCRTSEDVIFTGPYGEAPYNRVTRGNEAVAAALRGDRDLKRAACEMKLVYRTRSQALLHGDLHTGSVMATATETRVIDAEWAFFGPMGFDIGALVGNLLLSAISQPGHDGARCDRAALSDRLLQTASDVWTHFAECFAALAARAGGELLAPAIYDETSRRAIVADHLRSVFEDMLGFAGAKMIRRIIGISHVEDFELIGDVAVRAERERHALRVARRLLLERRDIAAMDAVRDLVRAEAAGDAGPGR
ncbi:S-methyl-5-thioribose kinase [Fulvimarina sp. 2208YS6-2-32]|uniref:S-methyl-5-thioribose kinase n=1 Tax=Fulvimarina uroteuthidis TaxID=3098149 RepID=A0ABU5I0I2_9HYPH|nr:S-methyl-5-thioribose kinase [Fulvimarina sp. 2208YS6-2-32]MDY8108901.1 S-methyl-5-thioribose kinase [Fulvimarina sp. 2208YS6-2-32]